MNEYWDIVFWNGITLRQLLESSILLTIGTLAS